MVSSLSSEGLKPQLKLDFGSKEVPEKLYDMDDALKFEEALSRDEYSLWTRYPMQRDNQYMFWYMHGTVDEYRLASYNVDTENIEVYSEFYHTLLDDKLPSPREWTRIDL